MMYGYRPNRPGKIVPILVVMLPALCGMAGLVVDTGLLLAAHRQVQNAADSAALAGAHRLLRGDTVATAKSEASTFVTNYNGLTNATVTVNIGPTTGSYISNSNYVEVYVSNVVKTAFLGVVGVTTSTVSARAVAGVESARINEAAVSYDPTEFPAIQVGSSATLTVNGSLVVNSPGSGYDQYGNWLSWGGTYGNYAVQVNSGGTLKAKYLQTRGGVNSVSSIQNATAGGAMPLYVGVSQTADPGSSLPVPMTSNVSSISSWTRRSPLPVNGINNDVSPGNYQINGNTAQFSPGVYQNITINSSATVTFNPGVYIFVPNAVGDGLNISGSPTVTGSGVMFYFAGSDYLSPSPGYYDNADGQVNLNSDGQTIPWPPDPTFTTMSFAQLRISSTGASLNFSGLNDASSPFNSVLFYQRRRPPYPSNSSAYTPEYGFQLENTTGMTLSGFVYGKYAGCRLGPGNYGAQFGVGHMTITDNSTVTLNNSGGPINGVSIAKQIFLVE